MIAVHRALPLFAAYGLELEYMLVDAETLDVLPVADAVLRAAAGSTVGDWENGALAWSNELVLHVLEVKTNGPVEKLAGVSALFQRDLAQLGELLVPLGGRLMPTAMHPWMQPQHETRLWPHAYAEVYAAFDSIFDCRAHGWANVQSAQINLPFAGDDEFARLHAAIRLVLPLVPALAASSPFIDGHFDGWLDRRLEAYRVNCARVPSVTGPMVPEPIWTRAAYETEILARIQRDLLPHDPARILQAEWVNARGAIARFDRSAIEIRLLDMQECPQADLGVAALLTAAVRALVQEQWASFAAQKAWDEARLAELLRACMHDAELAPIDDAEYLSVFGLTPNMARNGGEVWRHLASALPEVPHECQRALAVILEQGPLARRILAATGLEPTRARLQRVYRELCDCLDQGRMFGRREVDRDAW
ncbi:MAG TPA: glutamate-cysteine ligase family protein [Candidatus Krumholzibacteria bacterium]|nr:glutamate-cysteine ligase family protein [Candidatus Krumholzibacteria bacterium]